MTQKRQMTLSRLLADFAHIEEGQNVTVNGVQMDSRKLSSGELFLACRSVNMREHGASYARNAFESGANAVVVDLQPGETLAGELVDLGNEFSRPVIPVEDLDQKAGVIASRFYQHPSQDMTIIGVTGTNGKTSVTQFIAQCLTQLKQSCGVIGTLGSGVWGQLKETGFTTPLAVAVQESLNNLRAEGVASVAMEVSSHGLEQGRAQGVAFDIAVLTNLSRDHLDYHGDMESYAQAKEQLFRYESVKAVVLNIDDDFGKNLSATLSASVEKIGYSLELENSNAVDKLVSGRIERMDSGGMVISVHSPWGNGQIRSSLMGRFNAQNLLAVLSTLLLVNVSLDDAIAALNSVAAPAGRMERFGGTETQPVVIVDYAHTPDALRNVLSTLRDHCKGDLWVVFGCGGDRDAGKRPEMGSIAEILADHVIITDDNPRTEDAQSIVQDILSGIKNCSTVKVEHDRELAITNTLKEAVSSDMVLIAGKGHEDYQILGTEKRHFSDREVVEQFLGVAA
jgi:UDP-N-acetylmuramoyl-L-alanyl-D-glutamate--2,6-diaminopimelate ligase